MSLVWSRQEAGAPRVPAFLSPRVIVVAAMVALVAAGSWLGYELRTYRAVARIRADSDAIRTQNGRVLATLEKARSVDRSYAESADELKARSEVAEQWSRRTLSIENQAMSRVDADRFFEGLLRSPQSFSAPSVVNVRVAKAGDSIFTEHQGLDAPSSVIVTIRAELFSRSAQ